MLPVLRSSQGNWVVPGAFDWFDREFGRMARQFMSDTDIGNTGAVAYPVDMREDDENIYVEAELPGYKKDEINVTLEKGVLQISAERSNVLDENETKGTQLIRERRWARYFRSFTLPTPVSEGNVKATFEDGVLHLTLPKRPEVKPRRIAVS